MERFVETNKITAYLLNDNHPDGGRKSKFFKAFGFSEQKWEALRFALLKHPLTADLVDTDTSSEYGQKNVYECRIETPDGRDPCIRTVWQQSHEGWRLITAYPFV
jgi:filamentous hemagglutinin